MFVSRDALQAWKDRALMAEARIATLEAAHDALLVTMAREILTPKAPSYPTPPAIPSSVLGPKTKAALADMGKGQSGPVKRAMEQKALGVWHSLDGNPEQDSRTATAVYRGEPVAIG